ncbi:uncharacterized protein LOC106068296 isoform X1 [Biomphalaria glabrata]|uniref:Uncharacterized protein LOC106068296 isoform X1 n=1 Tax=Biomphalaria glabrata TaxID=6526 RepID=A0A9W3AVL3_BIOGL|nr:uncharacterized protein LOC106068296 isoform X1 [Biomphalaria glabrata]XP_055891253.1 uncharacterized protein LOC106068296 isoform X1 [Biomphalaria glabrata]XP_055891254.1 uncharacterized protein LOC106068296 isoform X1 [Biomphalaria glabrata]XP_055891255.1 uncharacterized protein LOC106068296 isoform X1 [Biomphalaria glabrata]
MMAEQEDSVDNKTMFPEHEGENENENEHDQEQDNENENDIENDQEDGVNGDGVSDDAVDTTADFLKIFQGKTEFDSWEEFSTLFEEFQKETGSAFKPKSATSLEYANERRVKDKIPDRFVYQTVKMVCNHYGNPIKKENSARKAKRYVGLGCEAMVHLRYKAGSLNIVSCNLEHKNHKLFIGNEIISRSVRSFSFTDDIDFLMAKVVMEHNPFSTWNSEKEWLALVDDLQSRDSRMKTVTIRVVKKRIRFLIDRYMANSNGKPPLPDDEMGIILYELAKAKQDAIDNVPKQPPKKRGRGRPRKREREETEDEEDEADDSHMDFDDSPNFSPGITSPAKKPKITARSSTGGDLSAFLRYLERKDEYERKLRQTEMDLRREELELHKKELEMQREKFEFDRLERQAHLELLKAQLETFTGHKAAKIVIPDGKVLDGNAVTEYTIVVNNDQAFATQ